MVFATNKLKKSQKSEGTGVAQSQRAQLNPATMNPSVLPLRKHYSCVLDKQSSYFTTCYLCDVSSVYKY